MTGTASPAAPARPVSDAGLRGFAGYGLRRAMGTIQADLARTLEPFGLRMLSFSALAMIADNPGLRPSELAAALGIERSNLVSLLDDLRRRKLVARNPAPGDRRAAVLTVTAEGAVLCARARKAVADHDARMTAGLTPEDRNRLLRYLRRIETAARPVPATRRGDEG